ncbi:MAG: type III polyketide synthase, partial [Candidatus Methylomirabilia bacterium]
MATPKILGVATATPPTFFPQSRLAALAGYDDPQRLGFFSHSEIDGRYLYLDPENVRTDESADELNDRFQRGARELARAAALRCLERARWKPQELDFLATTTCTGRLCPSLDAHLIEDLGCSSAIQRVHVGDTGCASAMVALQQAYNHLQAFPGHRALVVAVEICSAAYYLDDRLESAVAHAIFADGAGALALGCAGEGMSVQSHRTLFRPEHLAAMGFAYPGGRPRVILSKEVRRIGAAMMKEMTETLLDSQGLKQADVSHWILHSAGRRVIEQVQRLMNLDESAVKASRTVLRRYGNMSSATIIFVLEELLRTAQPVPGDWGVMIALGPGFAAEGALLR